MSQLPKIVIKMFGSPVEDVYELEHARYLLNFDETIVVVEGQEVHSYDELVRIAAQEKYKNQERVEVVQLPLIAGG